MKIFFSVFSFVLLMFNSVLAQIKKDTIYLDEEWSICEKPVAEHFRVATIKTEEFLMYVGEVNDYYIDGTKEMTGFYEKGKRLGHFTFYSKNGNKKKEGDFANDDMIGIWNYYDDDEKLVAQFDCKSSVDFTPLLIVNTAGDTLLKNGDGRFEFDCQKDLPGVFTSHRNYVVTGKVRKGKKEGQFRYAFMVTPDRPDSYCIDVFMEGKFQRSLVPTPYHDTDKPCNMLNLMQENRLLKTDNFSHTNLVFGRNNLGEEKLIKYLLNGEIPEIISTAKSFPENIKYVYDIIGAVLRPYLTPVKHTRIINPLFAENTPDYEILYFETPVRDSIIPRIINCEIALTIDSDGYISNSVFKGNLDRKEINKINYYLSRLSNLAPYEHSNMTDNAVLQLRLLSIVDTFNTKSNDSKLSCLYVATNADSITTDQLIFQTINQTTRVVGGEYVWKKYLEKNAAEKLNGSKIRSGTYDVLVKFMVDEDGNINDVSAMPNKHCQPCVDEAIRIIKEGPKWKVTIDNGVKIKGQHEQEFTFEINDLQFFRRSLN